MKHINEVLAKDVLNKYIEMYEPENAWGEKDKEHFTRAFEIWMIEIERDAVHANPNAMKISLDKNNYLGKKTRALLTLLEIKEPKTLGELKELFVKNYGRKHPIGT